MRQRAGIYLISFIRGTLPMQKGNGLGLAMGEAGGGYPAGDISVESRLGEGSAFTFQI